MNIHLKYQSFGQAVDTERVGAAQKANAPHTGRTT